MSHTPREETSSRIMNEPAHLQNFRCMSPWIGPNYTSSRLLIVCESHYLPDGITTLHHDVTTWYGSRQDCVPNPVIHDDDDVVKAHSYMDTIACIEHYKCKKQNRTYKKIEQETGMSFDDFAFFNYIFRPVEKSARNYYHPKFNILDKDRAISKMIMEWFIREYDPCKIVIASTCVVRYGGVKNVLDQYREIKKLCTSHPLYSRHGKPTFGNTVGAFV